MIKQREKGIFYRMEYANNISQNEKEWLKKLEEERYEMDRAQKVENARLEGYQQGKSEGEAIGETNALRKNIRSMYKKGFDIETIADALEQDIEYVKDIIKSNS